MNRKNRYIVRTVCGLACALSWGTWLSGCSTFTGSSKSGSEPRQSVLPTDRERVHQPKTDMQYTSEELAAGVVKGDWSIEQVYGETPKGLVPPFLKFEPSEKRVYGNDGCNVINGSYTYNPADSTLSFSGIMSTMRACDVAGLRDGEIARALDSAVRYSWERRDTQNLLSLYDGAGECVMTLMHQNFQFLNGTWGVAEISGVPVDDPEMRMVIDVDEGRIHGNTGCNLVNGKFEIDMETANSISFSELATTRRACPDPERQTSFLVALEEAATARPIDSDRVALLNTSGETVLVLFRTTDRQQ